MSFGMSSQAATPLQAARLEIGWKQSQTIHAMRQEARNEGVSLASESSLKTMLSRWENGHGCPDAVGQRLLCRIYGRTAEDLGFARQDSGEVVAVPRIAPAVGPEIVEYFRNVFVEHVRADNLMGPHHLVDVIQAQTSLLEQMLASARGDVRSELLLLAFR